MPLLNKSDLYNLGLAVFYRLNNDMLGPECIMDPNTEEIFSKLCADNKNFEKDLTLAVKNAQLEYQIAISIDCKDYSDPSDFFEAKKSAE